MYSVLLKILQNFLDFSPAQAALVLQLAVSEYQRIPEPVSLDRYDGNFSAWLDNFAQSKSQANWFKGHDRSVFSKGSDDPESLWGMAEAAGFTQAFAYPKDLPNPDFSVVPGSGQMVVQWRLKSLMQDLAAGLVPTSNTILLLGSNRPLGNGTLPGTEQDSIDALGTEATESDMMLYWASKYLDELKATQPDNGEIQSLEVKLIDTQGTAERSHKDCVKTGDTAVSLKEYFESHHSSLGKSRVAFYVNQPFRLRMTRDMQVKLGEDYELIPVGPGVSKDLFVKNTSIFLGEVARLIHQAHQKTPELRLDEMAQKEWNRLFLSEKPEDMDEKSVHRERTISPLRDARKASVVSATEETALESVETSRHSPS